MSIQDFMARWEASTLKEQQAAQSHFNELCQLLGQKTPTEADPEGKFFTFEEHVEKASGGRGRADVWYKDHFAWEYKGKLKDLDAAYAQILAYKGDLGNPPLLVVCDFNEFRIYPQFVGYDSQPFVILNKELDDPAKLHMLEWLFTDPNQFLRLKQDEQEKRDRATQELAKKFAELAVLMRTYARPGATPWTEAQISRFLTRILFVLFAEDVALLPNVETKSIFRYIIDLPNKSAFAPELRKLFMAMDGREPFVMGREIPYFNGGLFAAGPDEGDGPEVLDVTGIPPAIETLKRASDAEWDKVSPTIFGTLFERALEEKKRAQLGAHYTSEEDIRLVVEPALMAPLRRQWEAVSQTAAPLLETYNQPETAPRDRAAARDKLVRLYREMADRLRAVTVLDPACGSGNFLYMSLRLLKDLEEDVRKLFAPLGLAYEDVVTPRQLFGIEKEPFAAMLARVVVWIGYLQWRHEHETGLLGKLETPILRDRLSEDEPEHIVNDDAIMRYDAAGKPYEPAWPQATAIVGNPPFLGDKRMKSVMGRAYVVQLRRLYAGRVPGGADLVCYWFEKARAQIENGLAGRAGLIATNSIRGGASREVLERIKETGDIFNAWEDHKWILDGAAVRVSIVGFDNGEESEKWLAPKGMDETGQIRVTTINADLTATIDVTKAKSLAENANLAFIGLQPGGKFQISAQEAAAMIAVDPKNANVLAPYFNADDIADRWSERWIIDFNDMSLEEASKYTEPMNHVKQHVMPSRLENKDTPSRTYWWLHQRSRGEYRTASATVSRRIFTPRVAKHRLFIIAPDKALPDSATVAFAREDDYFFGVLHSSVHEIWSLRQGTWLGVGNDPRYTPTTTFETFPLPWSPGQEDTSGAAHGAISAAAAALHRERDAWLNPGDVGAAQLRLRTLTNLYNALALHREGKLLKEGDPAKHFVARLHDLHEALDAAVLSAYGWDDLVGRLRTEDGQEEVLRRLLGLNLARGTAGKS